MLAHAALSGDLLMVAELVKTDNVNGRHSFDLSTRALTGRVETNGCTITPLWGAALNGHLAVIRELVDHGAIVDLRVINTTPLFVAAADNRLDVVAFLASHGGSIGTGGSMARSPLWAAAWHGHIAVVAWLIAHGADVNAQDESCSRSPLWCAVKNGHHDVVGALLAAGADVNARAKARHATSMEAAAFKGDVVMMRLLATRAIDDLDGSVIVAARAGAVGAVEWLVAMGADLGPMCHHPGCLLAWRRHFALEHDVRRSHHPRHVLMEAFLYQVGFHDPTCLEIAIAIGDVAIVTAQLNNGVDVHSLLPAFVGGPAEAAGNYWALRIRAAQTGPPMAALLKAAALPWARTRHGLFGKLPREQIETLLHCGVRLSLPPEITHMIGSFVTRKHVRQDVDTAWPDRRGALAICTVVGVMVGLATM